MAKRKSPGQERAVILGQPMKRPYGVKASFYMRSPGAMGSVEEVCVPLDTGAILLIRSARTPPWTGGKKYGATLEGFPTAASAESAGRRLVQSLLWMSVCLNSPLRLEYMTYEPCMVFDRNASIGASAEIYGEVAYRPETVFGELKDAYGAFEEPDSKLLLSMEIFCAAQLESSQRTIFLALMSSLEPLAHAATLGDKVEGFVAESIDRLNDTEGVSLEQRNSLAGRLRELKKESIRQALKRLAMEVIPDQPEASMMIDDAYALRSQLIHCGVPADRDVDLQHESQVLSRLIRDMYSRLLNRDLA